MTDDAHWNRLHVSARHGIHRIREPPICHRYGKARQREIEGVARVRYRDVRSLRKLEAETCAKASLRGIRECCCPEVPSLRDRYVVEQSEVSSHGTSNWLRAEPGVAARFGTS